MLSEISQAEKDKYQMISLIDVEGEPRGTKLEKQHHIHRNQEWTVTKGKGTGVDSWEWRGKGQGKESVLYDEHV